ncbi:hypothetical protein G6F50_016053 [Rhizopus delemar]|uniref:Uncharacterized protein n=1 Tax=Rhizopus delemar TaxID=936053 RepID=A0A9P7C321_9FUNG|nr:hypothetical protein G6F50_016053 [Rhizopus delemar]
MLCHERGQRLAGISEQHVLDERDAAGGAFDVGQDDAGLHGSGRLGGYVTGELLRDVAGGEVTEPAIRLGEEADRHEARLVAHVEPTLSPTCRVNRPEPATKKRTSSSVW